MDTRLLQILISLLLWSALPRAAWAAEAGGWGPLLTIGRLFNLALVIGVLVWIARKPLTAFLTGRSQSIQDRLAEAEQARLEAESKLEEIESRMSRLDEEVAEIRQSAEKEAREEYQRLMEEAERDARKVIERARREIEGMTRAAHLELKAHAADLSVELAEQRIRGEITDEDRGRLFSRFVTRVGGEE